MVRRFIFPIFAIFHLFGCSAATTIAIEKLADIPPGATRQFIFPTSGSRAEAYITRPIGPGPFPLMIFLHGHTLGGAIGAVSMLPEAEAFASDL